MLGRQRNRKIKTEISRKQFEVFSSGIAAIEWGRAYFSTCSRLNYVWDYLITNLEKMISQGEPMSF